MCREHNICEQIFYRWKNKYGGMELTDAKRFKDVLVHQLWGRK
ncbi:MAG: transposase [Gemmatimonadetes bacterium]|nr:transposase [Gemmatimonadota bacterium]MBT5327456.1 transposase [Gemmatimonadota bacterium]MBT5448857.1 transposase [Gemmatimonadota bacterium]MBT5800817.1 transposase [Gemmatimonadota bacterium]MBT6623437.1 transposase [Gemmatimonadota bacterium]